MSAESVTQMTRRQVWLTIALAIAEGLPEPRRVSVATSIAWIALDSHDACSAWARRLDPGNHERGTWVDNEGRRHLSFVTTTAVRGWTLRFDAVEIDHPAAAATKAALAAGGA